MSSKPVAERLVGELPGVGAALAKLLGSLGLERQSDLWFHLPLRYEDRTRVVEIRALQVGETAQVEGIVEAVERSFRFRPMLRVALSDASRQTLVLRFFHFRTSQVELLKPGTRLRCFGEVRHGAQGLEMIHPQYQRLLGDAAGGIEDLLTPVYPTTAGLAQPRLRKLIQRALLELPAEESLELLPASLRKRFRLTALRNAVLFVHRPPPDADLAALAAGSHPAQQRLVFEELLAHHLSLKRLRAQVQSEPAPRLAGDGSLRSRLLQGLPFRLTRAQERVVAEIAKDLAGTTPMLRLVQGDVGSGKTVVAALAALSAVECGWQAALAAPTELLAEQHYRNFSAWLAPLGLHVAYLASKIKGRARRVALAATADHANVVIGTHALLQEDVAFRRLGLAIIDEQHRFGVHQRLLLRDKGRQANTVPHQLVLTATPIPRTLAMTACADLDISALDELPPGRTPVTTVVIGASRREEVIARIRHAVAEGRQAYWVCTLIEATELLEAQAAEAVHTELRAALPGMTIGLVHGRLKPAEKQAAMAAFASGASALLVATTVIEVGVDVPRASLMVIENAERLGLAQLHQLRGRIGRGAEQSSCVLLYQPPLSMLASQRLNVMRETNDGFRIAEKDLELRGPGELLGTRQTGQLAFRLADLARDAHLLPDVQKFAAEMLRGSPQAVDELIARWIGSAARFAAA